MHVAIHSISVPESGTDLPSQTAEPWLWCYPVRREVCGKASRVAVPIQPLLPSGAGPGAPAALCRPALWWHSGSLMFSI